MKTGRAVGVGRRCPWPRRSRSRGCSVKWSLIQLPARREAAEVSSRRPTTVSCVLAVDRCSGRRRGRSGSRSRPGSAAAAGTSGETTSGRAAGCWPWCRRRRAAGRPSACGVVAGVVAAPRRRRCRTPRGSLDVLLDVRRFLGLLVRLDLELLHDRRVDPADQDRGEHQQAEADAGQQPGAPPDVGEEQQRADDRDAEQDRLGRQHGVDVGVAQAGPVVRGLKSLDFTARP